MIRQVPPGSRTIDKVSPIGASPIFPRRHSRLAHSSEQKALAGAEPIAIIGRSGKFPQAPDVQKLAAIPNASNLAASSTYDTPTLHQQADFPKKDSLEPTSYRTDIYSVILAPNPSLLTGAGTNTIVLGDQSTGAVVIDPAIDDPEYLSAIIQEGQRYGGIRRILITHGHSDHIDGAEALRTQLGVPILAFSNKKVPFADEEIADSAFFPIGDDMLRAIYTPGHCFDHLCFWLEKQHILFAGDLLTSSGPTLILPPPEGNVQDYIHSLQRVQHLESVEIIPAHGETILRPQEMLAECLARCQKRNRS